MKTNGSGIIFISIMSAIICNQCKVLVLKTANLVCLSCGAEHWGFENDELVRQNTIVTPYTGPEVSGYTVVRRGRGKANRMFLVMGIGAALILLLLLAGPMAQLFKGSTKNKANAPATTAAEMVQCNLSQSAIYEQYKYSVGLVWHEYVYMVRINGSEPIEFTRNRNGQFVLHDDGGQPITVTGTGFFADSAGLIVTNKHVVAPWTLTRGEIRQLRNQVLSFLQSEASEADPVSRIRNGWRKRLLREPDSLVVPPADSGSSVARTDSLRIDIKPKTFFLGLVLQDMMADKKQYIPCTVTATDPLVDLALMQTASGQLPANAGYVRLNNCILDHDSLKPGSRAIMVGFPMGMDLARASNGKIRIQVQEGFINNESDDRQVLYNIPSAHGASGSPVFNDCGRLIAVNYAGYDGHPFNLGIPAKHVVYLVGRQVLAKNNAETPR